MTSFNTPACVLIINILLLFDCVPKCLPPYLVIIHVRLEDVLKRLIEDTCVISIHHHRFDRCLLPCDTSVLR